MKFNTLFFCTALFVFISVSCKNDQTNSVVKATSSTASNLIQELQAKYTSEPSPASANTLIAELMKSLGSAEMDKSKRAELLNLGYKVAKEQNISARTASFLYPILKESPTDKVSPDQINELARLMKGLKKESAANVLYKSILDNYANSSFAENAKSNMTTTVDGIDKYILDLGSKLFESPDEGGLNKAAAHKYVDACEAFGLGYPNHPDAAENIFKAAEVAKSLRTFNKSLSLYDWVIDKYPTSDKAATSLFLKGFIIENNLGNDEKAKELYNKFISTYPDHDLADDVAFLIENLGKSDEEILEMIEERQKQNKK